MRSSVRMNPEKIERQITCTICPNSCRITAWIDETTEEVHVEGYTCPKGLEYGYNEYTNPVRTLITTMRIENGTLPVIPVRSNSPIPKPKLKEAIGIVNQTICQAPIKMGDIVIENIFDTGINVIASRNMDTLS